MTEDFVTRYRAVLHEILHGTDESVLTVMAAYRITFAQMDERLRTYGDSIMADLISNRKFQVALAAWRQGMRHAAPAGQNGNEFHLLAAQLNCPGALAFGYELLADGADLGAADCRGINGLYALLHAGMLPVNRNDDTSAFLAECIRRAPTEVVHAKNRAGVSAWDRIRAGCDEALIRLAESVHGCPDCP